MRAVRRARQSVLARRRRGSRARRGAHARNPRASRSWAANSCGSSEARIPCAAASMSYSTRRKSTVSPAGTRLDESPAGSRIAVLGLAGRTVVDEARRPDRLVVGAMGVAADDDVGVRVGRDPGEGRVGLVLVEILVHLPRAAVNQQEPEAVGLEADLRRERSQPGLCSPRSCGPWSRQSRRRRVPSRPGGCRRSRTRRVRSPCRRRSCPSRSGSPRREAGPGPRWARARSRRGRRARSARSTPIAAMSAEHGLEGEDVGVESEKNAYRMS